MILGSFEGANHEFEVKKAYFFSPGGDGALKNQAQSRGKPELCTDKVRAVKTSFARTKFVCSMDCCVRPSVQLSNTKKTPPSMAHILPEISTYSHCRSSGTAAYRHRRLRVVRSSFSNTNFICSMDSCVRPSIQPSHTQERPSYQLHASFLRYRCIVTAAYRHRRLRFVRSIFLKYEIHLFDGFLRTAFGS